LVGRRYLEEKADFGTAGGLVEFKDDIMEGNPQVCVSRFLFGALWLGMICPLLFVFVVIFVFAFVFVLPCFTLPYLTLPYLTLSCLVLSCLVLILSLSCLCFVFVFVFVVVVVFVVVFVFALSFLVTIPHGICQKSTSSSCIATSAVPFLWRK
jgi:hypothetical protein